MSADREELARLVQEIPDDQLPEALADLRQRLRSPVGAAWPPAWFGIAEGDGTSVRERSDDLLAEGFGR